MTLRSRQRIWWYLSTPRWTGAIAVEAGVSARIVATPPLLHGWIGLPVETLIERAGPDVIEPLPLPEDYA